MSKAYMCDSCMDLYVGDPAYIDNNGNELCHTCLRCMKMFGGIDPFSGYSDKEKTDEKAT